MASTFTPNIQLEEPARGDDVGTWDTPVNGNMTLVDLVVGGIATISLNNSPVVLSAAQFKARQITFNSTLTGNVLITFPTSFTKDYEIQNLCTGSSAFNISLISNGLQIGCPPGQIIEVVNDGTNMKYKNLPPVGTYMDYAGAAIPAWIANCGVPPYLNCDGTSFSSATYPALANILGTTTLPDSRGRGRYALDAGAGRVSSGVSGVAGNTRFAGGGDQSLQSHSHANTLTDPGHLHGIPIDVTGSGPNGNRPAAGGNGSAITGVSCSAVTGITINNVSAGAGGSQNMPPVFIGGITMIRAG